jgi:hypothetical protein
MPRPYTKFIFEYPPRPELKTTRNEIDKYLDTHLAQPKLNGSCCSVFMNETETKVFNRHNGTFAVFKIKNEELRKLYKGTGWMCLVGEYMNKSKMDKDNKIWNEKFVIFDIIIYNGIHLTESTFEERVKLLDEVYGQEEYDEYLYKINDTFFRVKTFYENFSQIFDSIVKIDMLEGLVLKRINGKLERGLREKNNVNSQIKIRKPTLNYQY